MYEENSVDYSTVELFLRNNVGVADTVNLHGGEPTIHPRFLELLALIQSLGYRNVTLQTNAITLEDRAFAEEVYRLGVHLFIVSLHGDTAESHDSQTHTTNGFKRTIAGISNVLRAGAKVRTNTVITRLNLGQVGDIANLACGLGVHHVNFSNLHPVGSATFALDRILPRLKDVEAFLRPAVETCLANGRAVTLEGFPYCCIPDWKDLCIEGDEGGIRMLIRGTVLDNYNDFMKDTMRIYGPPCQDCTGKIFCGGVYPEYIQRRGWSEFQTILA